MPDTTFTELLTSRLRLRRFTEDDAAAFAAYRSDPDTARFQGWDAPYTRQQADDFIAGMRDDHPDTTGAWFQFAVERRGTPGLIGDVAAHVLADEPGTVEVGITFAPDVRGQGYATEALARLLAYLFDERGAARVIAATASDNTAVARLLTCLGFEATGQSHADDGVLETHWYLTPDLRSHVLTRVHPGVAGGP